VGSALIDQITIPLAKGVEMTFNRIEACGGQGFLMGSRGYYSWEEPIHRVIIPDDFWMGETPVTQAQFAVWTKKKKVKHTNHFAGNPNHPAESMTWHQASDFCNWLTELYGKQLPAKHPIATLPTEAHWEYACRAGTTTEYCTGDGEVALREAGWFGEEWGEGSTHSVATLQPNNYGLYEMHGNVWEWCLDRWDEYAYRRRWDDITPEETFGLNEQFGDQGDNPLRVMRGGSWFDSAVRCRAAYRNGDWAGYSSGIDGFRVCLVRSPPGGSSRPASRER
jgi:formylglycine-generating enzyme required for sulfatase activity